LSLGYVIKKVHESQEELNGTYQLHVYADNINLLGDKIHTVNRNMKALIEASKEFGLEANTERIKCGNLPQCKTDNSHRVAKAGDIYTRQIAAWL
jgi:hypothetical protein